MPLELTDFDQAGLEVDALALIVAAPPPNVYMDADRGGTQTPEAGEIGIGEGETRISRLSIMSSGARVRLNDNDNPVAQDLNAHFGPANTVSPWTLYIQTDDGVASSAQLGRTGRGFANYQFETEGAAILNAIAAGDRVLIAFARAAGETATLPAAATFESQAASLSAVLRKHLPEVKPVGVAFDGAAASLLPALSIRRTARKPIAARFDGEAGSIEGPAVTVIAALLAPERFLEAIAADLKRQLPKLRTCEVHDGGWDAAEVKRWPVGTPALLVAWLGTERTEAPGLAWTDCDQQLAVFVVTADGRERAGGPLLRRGEALRNLVDWLLLYIPRARWMVRGIGPAENLRARNVYSAAVDRDGIALAEVSWRQTVRLESAGNMDCPAIPGELYASPQQDPHERLYPEAA